MQNDQSASCSSPADRLADRFADRFAFSPMDTKNLSDWVSLA